MDEQGASEAGGITAMSPDARFGASPVLLLAEDEALIGYTLGEDLIEEHFTLAGPFSRSAEALAWLEVNAPDCAILDYRLRDGPATRLAAELRRRGVPFIVFSGHDRGQGVPADFVGVPWVEKPAGVEAIQAALQTLIVWPAAIDAPGATREQQLA